MLAVISVFEREKNHKHQHLDKGHSSVARASEFESVETLGFNPLAGLGDQAKWQFLSLPPSSQLLCADLFEPDWYHLVFEVRGFVCDFAEQSWA